MSKIKLQGGLEVTAKNISAVQTIERAIVFASKGDKTKEGRVIDFMNKFLEDILTEDEAGVANKLYYFRLLAEDAEKAIEGDRDRGNAFNTLFIRVAHNGNWGQARIR